MIPKQNIWHHWPAYEKKSYYKKNVNYCHATKPQKIRREWIRSWSESTKRGGKIVVASNCVRLFLIFCHFVNLGRRAHQTVIAHHRHPVHPVIVAVAAVQHPHQVIPHPAIRTVQSTRKPNEWKMAIKRKPKNTRQKNDEPNANRPHQVPIRNKLPIYLESHQCAGCLLFAYLV